MQATHHRMDRNVRKEAPDLGADIDDPRMGAGAEDDQAQIAHIGDDKALVHQKRIGAPGRLLIVEPAEMIGPARLERGHAGDLAAVVKMPIQEQAFLGSLTTTAPCASISAGEGTLATGMILPSASSTPRSLNMPGLTCTCAPAAVPGDGVEGGDQRPHMIPMAMGDGDGLHIAQLDGEIPAVADEGAPSVPVSNSMVLGGPAALD